MGFAILGLGTALPSTRISQAEAVSLAERICCRSPEEAELLPALYRHTTIAERHLAFDRAVIRDLLDGTRYSGSVFLPKQIPGDLGPSTRQRMEHYRQQAGPLARRAAEGALLESGLKPRDLTHLITVSCSGFHAPGVDIEIIKHLGLPSTVERSHIGFMGCHGALNGLRVARAYAQAEPQARVLLCAVELCGLHFHYGWNPKKAVSNALFADGAAAVVGASSAAASAARWQATASGSCLIPDSEYAMSWSIGDHGFEMTLSTRVPELIHQHLRPWLEAWLQQHGLSRGEIGTWAVHPGGPRILTAVEEALDLDRAATAVSREVLASCGNMSSPTVLFILDLLRQRQAPRPCVALGFGPGLAVEAALFV
jgi:predicted naringenin-chalcone synthase